MHIYTGLWASKSFLNPNSAPSSTTTTLTCCCQMRELPAYLGWTTALCCVHMEILHVSTWKYYWHANIRNILLPSISTTHWGLHEHAKVRKQLLSKQLLLNSKCIFYIRFGLHEKGFTLDAMTAAKNGTGTLSPCLLPTSLQSASSWNCTKESC